ncbi:MAG TPA: glycoside hydrolase family 15 protein [Lacunisphaera sp.]|nr:glycoside hydrolase family 15 protein [Lacunisphaera sp.]
MTSVAFPWSPSRKEGVGTAPGPASRLWYTIGRGVLNELYYPTLDQANTREGVFLVTAARGWFSAEADDTVHRVEPFAPGVPGYRVVNTCRRERYRITKTVFADPARPVLLMHLRFEALAGELADYRLFFSLVPQLGNQGEDNHGRVLRDRGTLLLAASRGRIALAAVCSVPWCGAVAAPARGHPARRALARSGTLVRGAKVSAATGAELLGEIATERAAEGVVVAIGFGDSVASAACHVRAALGGDWIAARRDFESGWRRFQASCRPRAGVPRAVTRSYRISTAVLRTHESKEFPGAIIASLSIPWGNSRGSHDLDAYHFVWPRDQARAAIGLLAAGHTQAAQAALRHLLCTQLEDGSWPQNMWVNGRAHRSARQIDQAADFLLLVAVARSHADLPDLAVWAAARRAADFILRTGPSTEEDRWEECRGRAVYSVAAAVAALVVAAELADGRDDLLARRCRETADAWNAAIEDWLYVRDSPLARRVGVEGYYVRLVPDRLPHGTTVGATLVLPNRGNRRRARFPVWAVTSPDVLGLVRFGLRAGNDPRIENTVRVIDATLGVATPAGPAWRRYNHDGYGETPDGQAFDGGRGDGRAWPLLTGERAHYELARGHPREAGRLLRAMIAQSGPHGLLPEQIWDAADLPACGLRRGGPTGSAMPLVWAHAELVTLMRSLSDGAVFDCPEAARRRYGT